MESRTQPLPAGLQAILFDLDGTLLDSAAAHYDIYVQLFAEYGITFTRQQYNNAYSPDWTITYQILGLPVGRVSEANRRWLELASAHVPPLFEGVPDMLARLAGSYRLGLVTSGTRSRVLRDLEVNGIVNWFETIVTGGDVSTPKPDPEGILAGLQQLGVQPADALYVGDTVVDYQAASAAGVHFAAVQGGHSPLQPDLPCVYLDAIDDLARLLG